MSGRDRSTIVVEPSDYVLRNAGDMAMMQVAMGRLAAMFPDADIAVFSDVPDELTTPAPNVRAVDATGRRLWLHTPLVPDGAVPGACVGVPLAPPGGCADGHRAWRGRPFACVSTRTGERASMTTSRCWPGPTSCWPRAWGA